MSDLGDWIDRQLLPDREQILRQQPSDFAAAGEFQQLYEWLTDFGFIQRKLFEVGLVELILDYSLALALNFDSQKADTLRLIQGALRKSAHILKSDKTQLAGQLRGRLLCYPLPNIQEMLLQAQQWLPHPWLCPRFPCLEAPGEGDDRLVYAVAVTPDGRIAVSGSGDGTIQVWDLATRELRHTLETLEGEYLFPIYGVAVTADGCIAVSGSADGTIQVWDLETGERCYILPGEGRSVLAVAVTPDGRIAVSGSDDGTVKVWDLEIGELRYSLAVKRDDLIPPVAVYGVAITADGRIAVSAAQDKTLKVWNLETAELVATFAGDGLFSCVGLTPDVGTIVAGDYSGKLYFLNLVSKSTSALNATGIYSEQAYI